MLAVDGCGATEFTLLKYFIAMFSSMPIYYHKTNAILYKFAIINNIFKCVHLSKCDQKN